MRATPPAAGIQIGEQIKESSRDAVSALALLARDPVSGMLASWKALGPVRAQAAGLALSVGFALFAAVGLSLGARRMFGGFLGYLGGDATTFFKLFLAMLVLPAAVAATSFGIRRFLNGDAELAADLFTAGASLAPSGLAILASGLLGLGNFEVVALLFLFAFSYQVLMLFRGLTAIGGVRERAGAPATVALLAVSGWLTKIVLTALF